MKSLITKITIAILIIVLFSAIYFNKTKSRLLPLEIKLPRPMFVGTEKPI